MEGNVFPHFGRVAIVDDKYEEVRQVQNVLARKGVPYVFYDYQEMQDSEIVKVEGIRLLFLDIRLEEGNSGEKNLLTVLASAVERVIPIKNGPYAIILWTNEYMMKDEVAKYLNDNLDDSETTKPTYIGALDKKEFLGKPLDCLAEKFIEYYNSQNMLAFLTEIENNVMAVPANVVKMMTYSFVKDASNEALEKVFLLFAGTETGNCDSSVNATKTVLRQVADLIRDRYMEIAANGDNVDKLAKLWKVDFSDKEKIKSLLLAHNAEQAALINTALNVNTYSEKTDRLPGKVYKHTDATLKIDKDILAKSTFERELSVLKYSGKEISTFKEPIVIDITPSCDYAQGKNHMLRTLYGYIVYIEKDTGAPSDWLNMNYTDKIKGHIFKEYVYITPTFMIQDRLCVLLLNTKMMGLEKDDYSEGLEYLFRLNDEITNDIRKKTGDILSRIGFNSVSFKS